MLALRYNSVEKFEVKTFNTIARTIQTNDEYILNYFDNRSTNASAESFNAKVKGLRSHFRGVRDIIFSYLDCRKYMLNLPPPLFGLICYILIISVHFATNQIYFIYLELYLELVQFFKKSKYFPYCEKRI